MNSIGVSGAMSRSVLAASHVASLTWWCSRSPCARLPTWSWFCRQITDDSMGTPAGEVPRGPS